MANRFDKNGNKLYPISAAKHGHNWELAYNHLYLLTQEDEDTMREEGLLRIPDETYESYDRLNEIRPGPGTSWVTGKVYGELIEYSAWAEEYRGSTHFSWNPSMDEPEPCENWKIKYYPKDQPADQKEEIFFGTWTAGRERLKDLRKNGYQIADARRTDEGPIENLPKYEIIYDYSSDYDDENDEKNIREEFQGTWTDLQEYINNMKKSGCDNISATMIDPGEEKFEDKSTENDLQKFFETKIAGHTKNQWKLAAEVEERSYNGWRETLRKEKLSYPDYLNEHMKEIAKEMKLPFEVANQALELSLNAATYSDWYKDINGIRPRYFAEAKEESENKLFGGLHQSEYAAAFQKEQKKEGKGIWLQTIKDTEDQVEQKNKDRK